jgi:hypothetical protein
MPDSQGSLERIQTRRHLEDVNAYILHNEGEIVEAPGKLSLVWTDSTWNIKRFLAVKAAGEQEILVNGRRYPATEAGLRQGLRACLAALS